MSWLCHGCGKEIMEDDTCYCAECNTPENKQFRQARQIGHEVGFVTISLLQRRLQIGYTQASKIIDRMEEDGIIEPPIMGTVRRGMMPQHRIGPTDDIQSNS